MSQVLLVEPMFAQSPADAPSRVQAPLLAAAPSWTWWAARAAAAHQRVLSGRSATLHARLQALAGQLVGVAAATAAGGDGAAGAPLAAAAYLDVAQVR